MIPPGGAALMGRCCVGARPPLEGGVLRATVRVSPENHDHSKALP